MLEGGVFGWHPVVGPWRLVEIWRVEGDNGSSTSPFATVLAVQSSTCPPRVFVRGSVCKGSRRAYHLKWSTSMMAQGLEDY